jgi:hypothetical protein
MKGCPRAACILGLRPHENVQVAGRADETVCGECVRPDDEELDAALDQLREEVPGVGVEHVGVCHSTSSAEGSGRLRITRPGMVARV